jgi:hypothetical protein
MRRILTIASVVTVIGVAACGSDYGMTGYSTPTSSPATSGGVPTLTVMNFLGWCSVTVNGGAASTGETVEVSVTPGSLATVVATPASSSFQIGADPWFGVDENDGSAAKGTDVGAGTSETSKTTVTIDDENETTCVSVCCQEPGNSPTPCPTTNPCP